MEWQKPDTKKISDLQQTLMNLKDSALEAIQQLKDQKEKLEKEKDGRVE